VVQHTSGSLEKDEGEEMNKSRTDILICEGMKAICEYLNYAHSLPAHDQMEKTPEYQRIIKIGKDLNKSSNEQGLSCFCTETKKFKDKKHTGHKFLKVRR